MNPFIETIGVFAIALLGIFLGRAFSRRQNSSWILGYIIALILIAVLVAGRFLNAMVFLQPFSWILAGRIRFIVLALAVTVGLTTPLSRLPHKFEKVLVCVLIAVVVTWFSILPFLFPALIKNSLLSAKTLISSEGICFQSRDYTCGPAAAVTALGKLGINATEADIAVRAHTSPVVGTLPLCLAESLEDLYASVGLKCHYQSFDSLSQLKEAGLTLAIVKNSFFSDHCVTILDVSDDSVTFADPVWGRKTISNKEFEKIWRFAAIVLKRDPV